MLRKIAIASAMALAVVVLAQGVALIGARGEGAAASLDGRVAEFRLSVSKLTSEPPRLGGNFAVQIAGHEHRSVNIVLQTLRNVAVGGEHRNVCAFGGTAVMRVRTAAGVQTFEGGVAVRVVDNARRRDDADGGDEMHRPDLIELTFHSNDRMVHYTFAGRVRRGDIDVFVRTR